MQSISVTVKGMCWVSKVVDAGVIDKINILRAALDAMGGAASAMPGPAVDYLLVDGPYLPQASRLPPDRA